MQSIINLKVWKKYIKRFSKRKLKQGDSSCLTSVPEPETSSKKNSFEQLSLYSTDSLEEKCILFRKYGSKKFYNQKSVSSESIITNSIKSDISEDSLQRGSLNKDSVSTSMKECIRNTNYSTESLKINSYFSDKVLLSKYQTRNRSQTVGLSYQLEKLFNRRHQTLFTDEQLHNHNMIPSSFKALKKHEALSIDSLDTLLSGRHALKKQYFSEDSLNEEKKECFNKCVNAYRKKSISDSLLHEAQYFQHLFQNKDFVILNKILSNEIKKQYNTEKILLKSNQEQHSLISLSELQYIEKYSEEDNLSIDSLSIPKSTPDFTGEITTGFPKLALKRNKTFSLNTSSYKCGITVNYESEDEKMSIDSLSIPQSELRRNTSSKIIQEFSQINEPFSPNTFWDKNGIIENSGILNCSSKTKICRSDSITIETNRYCHDKAPGRICNLNDQNLSKLSGSKNCPCSSEYYKGMGKEDSISLNSLCDSLN